MFMWFIRKKEIEHIAMQEEEVSKTRDVEYDFLLFYGFNVSQK